jgi:hypothetical protein
MREKSNIIQENKFATANEPIAVYEKSIVEVSTSDKWSPNVPYAIQMLCCTNMFYQSLSIPVFNNFPVYNRP